MRRGWLTGLGVAALCVLAAAAPAQAAFTRAPIELGPSDGNSPSIAVAPDGAAHVAWGVGEDLMRYCVVPPGARACAQTAALSLDARTTRPFLLRRPQDGLLIVVAGREDLESDPDDSVWAFTSLDGVNWSAPIPIAIGVGEEIADVLLTADGQAVDVLEGGTFVRAPIGGPPPPVVLDLGQHPSTTIEYTFAGSDLLRLRDGRTLALLASNVDGFAHRLLVGADPFADASWTPPRRVTTSDEEPAGAAGPRGAFVMYTGHHLVDQIRGAPPQVARRFRGTRWGRPRGLFYEVQANFPAHALEQDGRGQLHAAIVGFTDGGDRECIAYARTRKGRWFTRAVSLHQALRESDHPGRVRLAVNDRGRGVVAWASQGGAARLQRLKSGRGVTHRTKRGLYDRGCPAFPR